MLAVTDVMAQLAFDVMSTEALIWDHKKVRSKLGVRTAIQEGNAIIHAWVNDTVKGYKTVNDELDKYDRYFDMIDLILSGACTVINVYTSADHVGERLVGIKNLLQMYYSECLKHGDVAYSDLTIMNIGDEMVTNIVQEVDALVKSLKRLGGTAVVGSAVGTTGLSTKDLINILENVNGSIDNIVKIVDAGYLHFLTYVYARTGPFFNRRAANALTRSEIGKRAFDRWKNSYETVNSIIH